MEFFRVTHTDSFRKYSISNCFASMRARASAVLPAVLGGIVLAAAAGAVAAQTPSGKGATVRYQKYNSFGELLFIVAEERFCAKYALKCTGLMIPSGPLGIQSLLGNSLEIGQISTDATIRAISNGADVRVVMGAMSRVPFHVVARTDVNLPNKKAGYPAVMQDFKGKRIGVTARGAGVELVFDLMLRSAGMSPSDVTYVPVGGPPTAYGSMKSKQIDGLVLFQPLPAMCKTSDVCETVLDLSQGQGPQSVKDLTGAGATMVAKREYLEQNPEVMRAFVAAIQDAERYLLDPANYEDVKAISKRHIKLDVPNADQIFDISLKEWISNTDTRVNRAAIQKFVDLLHERNLIAQRLDPKTIVWSNAPGR